MWCTTSLWRVERLAVEPRNGATRHTLRPACQPAHTQHGSLITAWPKSQVALILDSLSDQICPQAACLKMVRQQHDAVGVEPLRLQGINAP